MTKDKDHRTNAYTVRYSDLENLAVAGAAAANALEVASWIRMVSVKAAQDAQDGIFVSTSDPEFEASVKARFPGYRVLTDARLEIGEREIRIGSGPAIHPSVHGIRAGEKPPTLLKTLKGRK
jgi:hypothetical protein